MAEERSQIDIVADYIMAEIPGEPSQNEGAGDTAVRMLRFYRAAIDAALHEIGVPQAGYPMPIVNAFNILDAALKGQVVNLLDKDLRH